MLRYQPSLYPEKEFNMVTPASCNCGTSLYAGKVPTSPSPDTMAAIIEASSGTNWKKSSSRLGRPSQNLSLATKRAKLPDCHSSKTKGPQPTVGALFQSAVSIVPCS